MIRTAMKDAWDILDGNWLKIIGMVLLSYFIKLLLGTLPFTGTISIRMDPLSVATSESFMTLFIAGVVNSIIFFAMVDYITNTQWTMGRRFVKAWTFPFRHPQLLYKGLIIVFINNLLLYFIGMTTIYAGIGTVITFAAGLNIRTGALMLFFLLLYSLIIWLILGMSQALYVLYDDPKMGTFRSIKRSFVLMKGHKRTLLALFILTALGLILGVLLLVIGVVFSLVLYEVCRLALYRELLRKQRQKEWQSKVNEAI